MRREPRHINPPSCPSQVLGVTKYSGTISDKWPHSANPIGDLRQSGNGCVLINRARFDMIDVRYVSIATKFSVAPK
jgi:hypothetical protein